MIEVRVEAPTELSFDGVVLALDREVFLAVWRHAEAVAEYARGNHVFQNRTGTLEGSIQAKAPTGSFSDGTLEVEVVADADYAEFVVARTGDDFLANAAAALESQLEADLAAAVATALAAV